MWILFLVFLSIIQIYDRRCDGLKFIDLPGFGTDNDKMEEGVALIHKDAKKLLSAHKDNSDTDSDSDKIEQKKDQALDSLSTYDETRRIYPPVKTSTTEAPIQDYRRHWLVSSPPLRQSSAKTTRVVDKDENIKSKINMLVQQTMHDTDLKMKSVQKLKDKYRDEAPYRVGFILSLIKKSRDVLNELFNVAIKHRDEWKALEQLKIFELIVHTNVDTTNLVRQLVEIHIGNLNSTVRLVRKRKSDITRREGGDLENLKEDGKEDVREEGSSRRNGKGGKPRVALL